MKFALVPAYHFKDSFVHCINKLYIIDIFAYHLSVQNLEKNNSNKNISLTEIFSAFLYCHSDHIIL